MQNTKVLGVLGGLGPASSVYFYDMLTSHTYAERDQDHLNIILSSRADTPDRTDFILGRAQSNPLDTMRAQAQLLANAGADIIAMPCNTAHYFYEGLSTSVGVPIINIIKQTAIFCRRAGYSRVGLLATEGTVVSGAYDSVFKLASVECAVPTREGQDIISDIIYNQIKKGKEPNIDAFSAVADKLYESGCDAIVLGCTELSLLKRSERLKNKGFVDSLEVLAYSAIKMCGATPVGFDDALMNFKV